MRSRNPDEIVNPNILKQIIDSYEEFRPERSQFNGYSICLYRHRRDKSLVLSGLEDLMGDGEQLENIETFDSEDSLYGLSKNHVLNLYTKLAALPSYESHTQFREVNWYLSTYSKIKITPIDLAIWCGSYKDYNEVKPYIEKLHEILKKTEIKLQLNINVELPMP